MLNTFFYQLMLKWSDIFLHFFFVVFSPSNCPFLVRLCDCTQPPWTCLPTCDMLISWLHVRFPFPADISPLIGETHSFLVPSFCLQKLSSFSCTHYTLASHIFPVIFLMTLCLYWCNSQTKSSCGMLKLLTRSKTRASREPFTTYKYWERGGRRLLSWAGLEETENLCVCEAK